MFYRNYPYSDYDCTYPADEVMSYVAYKEDYCYHLHAEDVEIDGEFMEDVNATMSLHSDPNPHDMYCFGSHYTYASINQQYRMGTSCMSGKILGNGSVPADYCIYDHGAGGFLQYCQDEPYYNNNYNYNNYNNNYNNYSSRSHGDAHFKAATHIMEKRQAKDFVHEAQNQRLYASYQQQKDKLHPRSKQVEDYNSNYYGGMSSSNSSYSSSSFYSYSSYYYDELFENWHPYGYKWVNVPRINVPMIPTAAPTALPGWARQQYKVDGVLVLESARRTGVCMPFYEDGELYAHYVAVCGEGKLLIVSEKDVF